MENQKLLTICAVIAVRNEYPYLRVLLPLLASQQIDVVILDNGSTDGSKALYDLHKNQSVREVIDVPFTGVFALMELLEQKQNVYARLAHDWLLHHDADEILQHRNGTSSLRETIEEADREGYTALNFEEFVFVPEPASDYAGKNYLQAMKRYYFFAPHENRLNRAWKRTSAPSNTAGAGHRLEGERLLISPKNHTLRHYIMLSQEHAYKKYLNRQFHPDALKKGWHFNRISFTPENLQLPASGKPLQTTDPSQTLPLSRSAPSRLHFWQEGWSEGNAQS